MLTVISRSWGSSKEDQVGAIPQVCDKTALFRNKVNDQSSPFVNVSIKQGSDMLWELAR